MQLLDVSRPTMGEVSERNVLSDSVEPGRRYCVVLHTTCRRKATPQNGALSSLVGLMLRTTDQAGPLFSQLTFGGLQIQCWWRPPSLCFCQASAAYSIAPKIEPAVQYDNLHAQHAALFAPPSCATRMFTAPRHETKVKGLKSPDHESAWDRAV